MGLESHQVLTSDGAVAGWALALPAGSNFTDSVEMLRLSRKAASLRASSFLRSTGRSSSAMTPSLTGNGYLISLAPPDAGVSCGGASEVVCVTCFEALRGAGDCVACEPFSRSRTCGR